MKTVPIHRIVNKRLSIWRRAADMINIQFGEIITIEGGTIGEYGLHIQCPFRWSYKHKIVTGSSDLYHPAIGSKRLNWAKWYEDKSWDGNAMEKTVQKLLTEGIR